MQDWNHLSDLLNKNQEVVILSHRSPDGDSIGSSLAAAGFLKKKGLNVKVVTPDPAPAFLSWMAGFPEIINFEKHKADVIEAISKATMLFCLDFNTLGRLGGELQKIVEANTNAYLVNIDHHQEPDDFADFQLSDTSASSTAQLIYTFVDNLGNKDLISKDEADCIYTGILTDTGSFRFSSTSALTHQIVAELMSLGVNPSKIHQAVYDNYSVDRLKLLGYALNEKFKILEEYQTAIIYLSEKELNQFNFQKGDTEGLVNYPLTIGSIKVSILITEKDGKVKMSFRSKNDIRINDFAKNHFSGGGHINAAGGISDVGVDETVQKIEKLLIEMKDQLDA